MLPILLRNTWAQKTTWFMPLGDLKPTLSPITSFGKSSDQMSIFLFLFPPTADWISVSSPPVFICWRCLVFIYEKEGRKGIGNATIFRKIELFVKHTTSLYLRQVEPKDECWDCSSLQPPLVELNSWTQSQKNFQLPLRNSTLKTLIKPDAPFGGGGYLHESTHHAFLFLNALEWYLL